MGTLISTLRGLFPVLKSTISALLELNAQFEAALARSRTRPGLPVPNPTTPYWMEEPPHPGLSNVQSPADCIPEEAEVVVIGSGIAGAAAAYSILSQWKEQGEFTTGLRETGRGGGKKILVLEARALCSGATARNGGHIKAAPYEDVDGLVKRHGKDGARRILEFQLRHLPTLLELCGEEGMGIEEAQARKVETVDVFLDETQFREMKKRVRTCEELLPGWKANVLEGGQLGLIGANEMVVGAIKYEAGALWPYRLVTGLWKRLGEMCADGLGIETGTAVEGIEVNGEEGKPCLVKTTRGVVRARHVIHATNGFAPHLVPGLRGKLTGVLGHMTAQEPGPGFPASNGGDGMTSWSVVYPGGFDYGTQLCPSSSPPMSRDRQAVRGLLMLGGGFFRSLKKGLDQVGVWDDAKLDPLVLTHLRGVVPALFSHPATAESGSDCRLVRAWSGIMGYTGDLLPLVGRLDERTTGRKIKSELPTGKGEESTAKAGEWIVAGFCGEGMVYAWLSGIALGLMVTGSEDVELEGIPGRPKGKMREWFPEELRMSNDRMKSAGLESLAVLM